MIARIPVLLLITILVAVPAQAEGPPFATLADLQEAHDRSLMKDVEEYVRLHPGADDLDQAYMTLFNKAIDHDWFAETESTARRYLAEQPTGAVRPLAQIVTTMARAQAGRLDEALASFDELMRSLNSPDQEEFASTFADTLAGVATTSGDVSSARRVYEALLRQFPQSPNLAQKVRGELARFDKIGQPAPTVEFKDLGGRMLRLADWKGKVVLVDFWATWCAPCLAELPNVQAAYDQYHARGFEVVAISLDEYPEAVADFVKARKLPWPQVHNASAGGDLVEAFGVSSIPATYLLNPEGVITRLELRGPALDRALSELLAPAK